MIGWDLKQIDEQGAHLPIGLVGKTFVEEGDPRWLVTDQWIADPPISVSEDAGAVTLALFFFEERRDKKKDEDDEEDGELKVLPEVRITDYEWEVEAVGGNGRVPFRRGCGVKVADRSGMIVLEFPLPRGSDAEIFLTGELVHTGVGAYPSRKIRLDIPISRVYNTSRIVHPENNVFSGLASEEGHHFEEGGEG